MIRCNRSITALPLRYWLLGAGAVFVLFFFRLSVLPLFDPDEARYAETSRTMWETGDWIVPMYAGEIRLEKPILFYWLQAAAYSVFQSPEVAARVPSALSALGITVLLFVFGSRRWGMRYGLVSALTFAVFPLSIALARTAITDMTLAFWVTASALAFLTAYREGRGWPLAAGYAALALALLTKGPVALVFVGLVLFPLVKSRRLRSRLSLNHHGMGLLVFALVLVPWLILVTRRVPDIWHKWIWDETLERIMTDEKKRYLNVWVMPLTLLVASLPLSLSVAIPSKWKHLLNAWRTGSLSVEKRALLLWALVPVLFFSLSRSQRLTYILPCLPPLALLLAPVWFELGKKVQVKAVFVPKALKVNLTVFCAVTAGILLWPGSGEFADYKSAREIVSDVQLDRFPRDFTYVSCATGRLHALQFYTDRVFMDYSDIHDASVALQSATPVVMVCSIKKFEEVRQNSQAAVLRINGRLSVLANESAVKWLLLHDRILSHS